MNGSTPSENHSIRSFAPPLYGKKQFLIRLYFTFAAEMEGRDQFVYAFLSAGSSEDKEKLIT